MLPWSVMPTAGMPSRTAAVTTSSIRDAPKDKEPGWFVALNLGSIVVLMWAFVGYWHRGFLQSMGVLSPILLLLSLGWEICTAGRGYAAEIERHFPPDQRPRMHRFAIGIEILTAFPGYWFGSIAVLKAL